jgi:hypothetical protein
MIRVEPDDCVAIRCLVVRALLFVRVRRYLPRVNVVEEQLLACLRRVHFENLLRARA